MTTNSTGQIGLPPINVSPLGYAGSPINFVPITSALRDPTGTDINYATGTEWVNGVTLDLWKLYGFIDGVADWQVIATGVAPGGAITTISDTANVKVSPDGTGNVQLVGGTGIDVTSTPGSNLLTISSTGSGIAANAFAVDAHTAPGTDPVVPDGTGQVTITGDQVAAGAIGANVIRTDSLQANTITIEIQRSAATAAADSTMNGVSHYDNSQFTVDADGFVQLVGGSTPPTLGIDVQAHTAPGTDPVVPNGSGNIVLQGTVVAAQSIPIQTDSLAANTVNIEMQYAAAVAATDATKVGLAAFKSADFTVDASGFVALAGGPAPATLAVNVDAHTAPGTDPVGPDGSGNLAITGAQVAPGVVGANVIRTDSLAANAFTIEIQQTSAVAAKDTTKNGVSHFNSAQFTNDQGFITLVGGSTPPALGLDVDAHTAPGTDPVVPNGSGNIVITGAQVAAGTVGTNVIRSNSVAANTATIEIQRTTTSAATDVTKNGVSHFKSTDFTVDANGFVSLVVPATGGIVQQKRTSTTTYSALATAIPFDDTIPQVGEGTQLFSVSITPTSATSILEFTLSVMCGSNQSGDYPVFAIFQDGASNAIYATSMRTEDTQDLTNFCFTWYMTAGTTSSTTFTVRAGPNNAALRLYINGINTGRKFGGVASSSFYITEYAS